MEINEIKIATLKKSVAGNKGSVENNQYWREL